jgi:hypothetical protein
VEFAASAEKRENSKSKHPTFQIERVIVRTEYPLESHLQSRLPLMPHESLLLHSDSNAHQPVIRSHLDHQDHRNDQRQDQQRKRARPNLRPIQSPRTPHTSRRPHLARR